MCKNEEYSIQLYFLLNIPPLLSFKAFVHTCESISIKMLWSLETPVNKLHWKWALCKWIQACVMLYYFIVRYMKLSLDVYFINLVSIIHNVCLTILFYGNKYYSKKHYQENLILFVFIPHRNKKLTELISSFLSIIITLW